MTEMLDAIELKQKRNERIFNLLVVLFANPGFMLFAVTAAIYWIMTKDAAAFLLAGKITPETRLIIVAVSSFGVLIGAGVWVLYTRLQELMLEIRKP